MNLAGQWQSQVLSLRAGTGHLSLTLSAPTSGVVAKPGQFVAIAAPGPNPSALLRRTGWIIGKEGTSRPAASLEVVTSGRDWLADLDRKQHVDVIGPLGRPFSMPKNPQSCLLVGGGPATAALISLGLALVARNCRVEFLFIQSAEAGYGLLDARRIASATYVVSGEDAKAPGVVSREVGRRLAAGEFGVVYSGGPAAQVAPISAASQQAEVPHQCVLDFEVGCGIGTCGGCIVPVTGNDGVARTVRICHEGAVFNADLVQWDDLNLRSLGSATWAGA
jgi:dihydroorotate dehydrogenase electron transfer subunit